jgi:hypothetical protein
MAHTACIVCLVSGASECHKTHSKASANSEHKTKQARQQGKWDD